MRQRHSQTGTETETERQTDRQRHRERDRQTQKRDTETQRDRATDRQTDRQSDRETETETETERVSERVWVGLNSALTSSPNTFSSFLVRSLPGTQVFPLASTLCPSHCPVSMTLTLSAKQGTALPFPSAAMSAIS